MAMSSTSQVMLFLFFNPTSTIGPQQASYHFQGVNIQHLCKTPCSSEACIILLCEHTFLTVVLFTDFLMFSPFIWQFQYLTQIIPENSHQ